MKSYVDGQFPVSDARITDGGDLAHIDFGH
jgi:hypothetical protein